MENNADKSGGAESYRRSRSLDLHSVYKSSGSKKEGSSKRKSVVVDDGEVRKKRKARKEVLLSRFEQDAKDGRKSGDEVSIDGVSSDLPDSGTLQPGLNGNSDGAISFSSITLNFGDTSNVFRVPKRRRDFVGRSKFVGIQHSRSSGVSTSRTAASPDPFTESNGGCKLLEDNQVLNPPDNKASSDNKTARLNVESAPKVVSPSVKVKTGLDHLKKNKSSRVKSVQHTTLNNGDTSPRKRRNNHSKRKRLESGSESQGKKVEPLTDSRAVLSNDSLDEDVEKLEQNAASLLSSRFDPSCTGCSAESRPSASPSTNGLSFNETPGQDSNNRGANAASAGLESASMDSADRVLRPRKQYKEKGTRRKRRHFYEILSGDFDAHWVLNRRIKVFWPLDESWYFGLVNDYDAEKKIHHIKYDDREEEWVDLQKERFKLLLLPSEAPRKTERRSVTAHTHYDGGKKDLISDDDSFVDNNMESEPIISWLARSSRRVKSSALEVSKRRKSSHPVPNPPCEVSTEARNPSRLLDIGFSEKEMQKPSSHFSLTEASGDDWGAVLPLLELPSCSKDGKSPVVYVRRRYRKKDEKSVNVAENNNTFEINHASLTTLVPVVHSIPTPNPQELSIGQIESGGLLWSIDDLGLLRLNINLIRSKQFRLEFDCQFPSPLYLFGVENSWLLQTIMLLHYGTLVTIWPKVHLEMLFVDNFVGLRFLLFEGSLKQAVTFVSLVLKVFYQPKELGEYTDIQIPVTSVRFKLSCSEDSRKQHVFSFHSFSKLNGSKWLYIDSKLQRHCLLAKQLPLSECTYDNIKALEGGNIQSIVNSSNKRCSAFKGPRKESRRAVIPFAAFRESCSIVTTETSSNLAAKPDKFLPFAISFTAAPTFFRSLHLKLLMENSVACLNLRDHNLEHREGTSHTLAEGHTVLQDYPSTVPEITSECNLVTTLREAKSSQMLPISEAQSDAGAMSVENCSVLLKPSQRFQNGNSNVTGTSTCMRRPGKGDISVVVQNQTPGCSSLRPEKLIKPPSLVPKEIRSLDISGSRSYSSSSGLSVEIPSLDQVEKPADGKTPSSAKSLDLNWNINNGSGPNPTFNLTGRRSLWHHSRNSSSNSIGVTSPSLHNGKQVFISNGFGNGPKKPRTQVHYTLPSGGFDGNSKQKMHNQRGFPYKRIRRANDKRTLDDSKSSRNPELLACDANVLITTGDRGWRSSGARVILEISDHNEWRLAVKNSGSINFSYKASQLLQTGSTNRYTHAMMWRGGKDWVLEFPDRSQWILFKDIYEECYNRNLRAASVKNIPIPGVRLIEETTESRMEMPFIRNPSKYLRQLETDIDIAMDPSHVVYDLDSDDERWVSENQGLFHAHKSNCDEIPEEFFERIMDMLEKISYAQQSDHLTSDEIDNLMGEVGPMEVILAIHEHWRMKRKSKGMPLIRHLQPPLWERYEQKLKEWEHANAKASVFASNQGHGKAAPAEKPPMFAFCLKPRGLEVPNKGSKQRSQRRISVSGHSHGTTGDHDGLHTFGRRSNGFSHGDEKGMFYGNGHESSDTSLLYQASTRGFSPRNPPDSSEWNHRPKNSRNKSKKMTSLSSTNPQMVSPYNQRAATGKRNGARQRNTGLPDWAGQKHHHHQGGVGSQRRHVEQMGGSDLAVLRSRDANAAAHRAEKRARLKRERAQTLFLSADSAIHKAVGALMTAEAIKAASPANSTRNV